MKRFRRILVWVADTAQGEVALEEAAALSRESGAALTLAHSIEPTPRHFRLLYPQADELVSVLRSEWGRRLEALAQPLRSEGLEVEVTVLEGSPFLAFTREVLRGGHDLLVKPVELSENGQYYGSTDMHLLRKCPAAVWITQREAPPSAKILALVDPDPEQGELNRRILQMATSLGELRAREVHVLHAWQAGGEDLLTPRVPPEELARYVEQTRSRSAAELARLLDELGLQLPLDRVHLLKGDVRLVVPEFVGRRGVGLVVMGTVARTGIHGVLIGNTAETILSRVRCPVLTTKPAGFVSPVRG